MKTNPLAVARACLKAYVDKDREAMEALIANDYHFTSRLITHSTAIPTSRSVGRTARRWPVSTTSTNQRIEIVPS